MTVEELKAELSLIPTKGAINKARRAEIIKKIKEQQAKEGKEDD